MYYYKQIKDGKIISVEAKSLKSISSNFVIATKTEYDNFIASMPPPEPIPQRDLTAEIDELKARIDQIESLRI